MDAREAAMLALNACQRQGGWSDGALKKQLAAAELSGRDAALATQLCFGVLQNQMLLDFYLSKFSNIPLKRMEGKVVQTLRLGAYQMLFLTRIPHSAAVNSAVALVKAHCKNPRAAGMVNGILRSMERSLQNMPVIPQGDPMAYLSTLYSHPEWLVKEFILSLGEEETAQMLAADNSQPPTAVMVNTTRTTVEALKAMLEADHVEAEPHPWLENCLLLSRTGDLERLEAFQQGLFYVQDISSMMVAEYAAPREGDHCIDVCAAPGGKSIHLAEKLRGTGHVEARDVSEQKVALIDENIKRCRLTNITAKCQDATVLDEASVRTADVLIADLPCSGLGVLRRKTDIKYRMNPEGEESLVALQRQILSVVCEYVKPGGTLIYSTCTIHTAENEGNARWFEQTHPEFALDTMRQMFPEEHLGDGFFIAKFKRKQDNG